MSRRPSEHLVGAADNVIPFRPRIDHEPDPDQITSLVNRILLSLGATEDQLLPSGEPAGSDPTLDLYAELFRKARTIEPVAPEKDR